MMKELLLPLTLLTVPFAAAADSYDNLAQIELLPGWRTEAGSHVAALQITLKPGWLTYWRAPGDAGIPPNLQFSDVQGIESITPRWPTPEVIGSAGLRSIGYQDGVTVPLEVVLAEDAGDVTISGDITIGVCEEICIPVSLSFEGLLPTEGQSHPVIHAALQDQPIAQREAGVGGVVCAIKGLEDGLQVTTTIDYAEAIQGEHVVVETDDPRVWVSEAEVSRDGDLLVATVDMIHPSGEAFALSRDGLRITVLQGERAIDIQGCAAG